MTELEKPSVILRREAEKPLPNWVRGYLRAEMSTNGHRETCRCQQAILLDHAAGGEPESAPDVKRTDLSVYLAARWDADPAVFRRAVFLNDALTEKQRKALTPLSDQYGFLSKQMYHYLQRLAPAKLREVADHYERHGL